tara:strand:- start:462 stop:857 length:396 start_codon:yes stop_codon:yes gene_type:complete
MALNDLTGQNIQDTYQKVVQTDGTNLADGTGSLLPISFNGNKIITTNDLEVSGVFKIPGFSNVSSSLAAAVAGGDNLGNHTATQAINLDGNAIFGITDITATGNIITNGNISASGDITGLNIIGSIDGGNF